MAKRNHQAFRQIMGRGPTRTPSFGMPVVRSQKPLDPGALYHYWYPGREGVESAPDDFQRKLLEVGGTHPDGGPNLACVRPPAGAPVRCRCWLVFYRKPEVTYWLSPGWLLVMAWHDGAEPSPRPLPLDDRVLANLTLQSLRGGRAVFGRDFDNARQYFDHIVRTMQRDKDRQDQAVNDYRDDRTKDYYDATKIKNIGHGSKFALHHDGTIFPSRGEQNWLAERGRYLPRDVQERDLAETAVHARSGAVTVQADKHLIAQRAFDQQLAELKVKQQIREFVYARRRATSAGR